RRSGPPGAGARDGPCLAGETGGARGDRIQVSPQGVHLALKAAVDDEQPDHIGREIHAEDHAEDQRIREPHPEIEREPLDPGPGPAARPRPPPRPPRTPPRSPAPATGRASHGRAAAAAGPRGRGCVPALGRSQTWVRDRYTSTLRTRSTANTTASLTLSGTVVSQPRVTQAE